MIIEGLYYTKEHEWARIDGDTATMGITYHAQELMGEITYIELPAAGKQLKQKDELGVVESTKAASDVYAPVTGMVMDVNIPLESTPELINQDCYNAGWICTIKITDKSTLKNLMNAEQYEEYLSGLQE